MTLDARGSFDLDQVANRVRLLRYSSGLSEAEFAKAVGCSYRQIRAWEVGRNHPSVSFLMSVRHCFDIDPEWVLFGPGDVPLRSVALCPSDRVSLLRDELARRAGVAGVMLRSDTLDSLVQGVLADIKPSEERRWLDFAMSVISVVCSDRTIGAVVSRERDLG